MLESFDAVFPAIARSETRLLNVVALPEVPAGTYAFHEYHCTDPCCDCRTVVLVARSRNETVATVALWLDDPSQACLDPEGEQSEFANRLLALLLEHAFEDDSYVAVLERHYETMKGARGNAPQPIEGKAKVGRNEKCRCGSGKKFKKCCLRTKVELIDPTLPLSIRSFTRHGEAEVDDLDDDEVDDDEVDDDEVDDDEVDDDEADDDEADVWGEPFDEEVDELSERRDMSWLWTESVDGLLERLRGHGVEMSRERLREEATEESAWSLALAWTQLVHEDELDEPDDDVFLTACELWRRLGADRPFDEMLEDRVAEGYVLARLGERRRALEYWFSTWRTVKARWSPTMRTLDAASAALGLPSLQDWLCDFMEDLRPEALTDARVAAMAVEIVREILAAIPDEDAGIRFEYRVDLGDFLVLAGRAEEGSVLLLELIREQPSELRTHLCLAEALHRSGETSRALDVLDAPAFREALAGKLNVKKIESFRERLRAAFANPSPVSSARETAP